MDDDFRLRVSVSAATARDLDCQNRAIWFFLQLRAFEVIDLRRVPHLQFILHARHSGNVQRQLIV